MKRILFALTALLALAVQVNAQNPDSKKPAQTPQAPDVPAPKMGTNGMPEARFMKMHEKFVSRAKEGPIGVLFLGDSITEGWGGRQQIWKEAFGKYEPANFGIGGDRTQHVLWRILNGELEDISPKALVLMIGTNNSGSDSAEGIASGITRIVQTIREKLPQTKVLLLAVFPRGEKPNPQREKLQKVNATISKLDDGQHVFYMDIGSKFLEPDGTISKEIMPDYLHLSGEGYQRWANAITPKLAELTK